MEFPNQNKKLQHMFNLKPCDFLFCCQYCIIVRLPGGILPGCCFQEVTQRHHRCGEGRSILSSLKVRDLGVIFDECLTLDAHNSNICRRATFHLRNNGRIRMLLSFEATSQLIHALITTTLDYCNGSLFSLPRNKIKSLQRIENQAARNLKRIPRRNHITHVLKHLHWLTHVE